MINTLKDSKGYVIKCQFNLARIILHTALVAHLNIEIWKANTIQWQYGTV